MLRQLKSLLGKRPREAVASADPRLREARALLDGGRPDQAEQLCNQLLKAEPGHAEAHGMLGRIAVHRGKHERAVRHFNRAIELDAGQPAFRQGLAIAQFSAGNAAAAIENLEAALALDPQDPSTHNNLGNCHRHRGDLDQAIACYRKAIALNGEYLAAYGNLAAVLRQKGEFAAAVETCRTALRLRADLPEVRFHLGMALAGAGQQDEAIATLRELASSHPDYPGLLVELGLALGKADRFEEATAFFRDAIARQPNSALAHNCLGAVQVVCNDIDGAMASFRKALAIQPGFAKVHSNLLMTMNYQAGWRQKRLFQEAQQFDRRQAQRLAPRAPAFANLRDPTRKLRVGYLSPDLREHSVAHFTRNLFSRHNREQVEVYAYCDVAAADMDGFTRSFEAQADHWRHISGMEDEAVAERVREDAIDILVDLVGHTSDNRLLVFARRPAPIQVNWLGYPNTTGMRAMDYRLTDAIADPPGTADELHSEKLVRLEHGFLCYQFDQPDPQPGAPPCLAQGQVTFGSFNNLAKMTPDVVRLWARILESTPGSRLMLKSRALVDGKTRERCAQSFARHGIPAERLEMLGQLPGREEHLRTYLKIDIALDTFPYNGTTTSCEALWMGVPVVTLCGNRHAERVGASILQHAGLPELVAASADDYLQIARSLAGDPQRLTGLRGTLREQMRAAPLMDLRQFVDELEAAYRDMWQAWCERKK